MEFIQLNYSPGDGITDFDSYCFGKKVPDPNEEYEEFYKFRDHAFSSQNQGTGWYTAQARTMSFRLHIRF